MPLPKIPLPEPPTHLQELLDQARDTDAVPFVRLQALATLTVRLDRWFEEMATFCNERGGSLGMDAATLRRLAEEKEQHEPGETYVLEMNSDSGAPPSYRKATAEERERQQQ